LDDYTHPDARNGTVRERLRALWLLVFNEEPPNFNEFEGFGSVYAAGTSAGQAASSSASDEGPAAAPGDTALEHELLLQQLHFAALGAPEQDMLSAIGALDPGCAGGCAGDEDLLGTTTRSTRW